jgi:hypothetical protein
MLGRLNYSSSYDIAHSDLKLLKTQETHSVLFQTSPYGNLDAIVEHDGRAVYFYLSAGQRPNNRFGMRACWVRNLELGPHVINQQDMESGIAPMLPRYDCADPQLTRLPTAQSLEVVWLEEGNGAALFESPDGGQGKAELIAVIPPWSGIDGFHGYAANCINQTSVCWPMPDNPLLIQRIESAKEFWASWSLSASDADGSSVAQLSSDARSPFAIQQPLVLENYRRRLGIEPGAENYYAAGGDQFPPRGLLHHQTDRFEVIATAGMSVCPQPTVEMFVDDPANFRRIELALMLPQQEDSQTLKPAMEQLSGLSGYPWKELTWFRDGHTCGFRFGEYSAVLLVDDTTGSRLAGVDAQPLPDFRGDPVNLLWMLPLTDAQLTQLKNGTSTIRELADRWAVA